MKQSEQFFRLSDMAGYETKPILQYYGLNQAARAIVAVSAEPRAPWQLRGHGLTCPNLDEAKSLGEVLVVDQGSGKAFQFLAQHGGSPTLPTRTALRELWMSLPEGAAVPLGGGHQICQAAMLSVIGMEDLRPTKSISTAALIGVTNFGVPDDRQNLLRRFPNLHRLEPRVRPDGTLARLHKGGTRGSLIRLTVKQPESVPGELQLPQTMSGLELLACGEEIYANSQKLTTWLIPTIASNSRALTPIVTWWALLYTLSMLARYQPSGWTKFLDIDSSPDAPAVEYVLDEAHRACVNLIAHELGRAKVAAFFNDSGEDG
jgi:hypothetical protein